MPLLSRDDDDFYDPYDWRCWLCGKGFFDGAPKVVVDEENYCEECSPEDEEEKP